ncbi:MAG: terminase family protein [Candidatus Thiodiazotropha taylori]|uniref:Terminase family protein n=1 Tax=Candidatus Thiodiazotropha taylori TaxID=2792791 RepID=A0A9E4K8N1_9GAMM|nr:terminase family protein [Candidatus Thiodiazotropha taylori]MCW4255032.1 terminase family protein [Candidatus Thiodiazotropha taylori]
MNEIIGIDKEQFDPVEHKGWKGFGGRLYKNKRMLVEYIASIRRHPDAPQEYTHPHLFEKNADGIGHYMGNPNVKACFSNVEYTPEQIMEYRKCATDPIYFAETYVRIMSVDFGVIPFTLYDFQRDMVESFKDNRFTIAKLPRQCGKSTTSVAFILWYALFNPGKTIGILANKGELAQEMLGRLQLAYESLPFWLQQGVETYNKKSMILENGSKIIATSSSGSAARGMSFSLIFLDEFAFVEPHQAEDFFRSVYPTISSGADTKMIVVSTPKGMNHFYKMWMEAKEGRSQFNPIAINWWDVPGRDEEWKQKQIANTSEDQFRQEFNCLEGKEKITVQDMNGDVLDVEIANLCYHTLF